MEVRMWGVRIVFLMGAVSMLAGCASGRQRHELARLQSQVGLLDERIAQLERVGFGSAAAPPSFPSDLSADVGSTAVMPSTSPHGSAIRETAASGSFAKPSTRAIQEALKNAGFYQGAVDGKLGPRTREAIREFQRVHGLHEDGVVGRRTWAKLRTYADLSAGSSSTAPMK